MYCLNHSFAFLAGGRGWEGMFCSVVLLKKKGTQLERKSTSKDDRTFEAFGIC